MDQPPGEYVEAAMESLGIAHGAGEMDPEVWEIVRTLAFDIQEYERKRDWH